MLRNTMTDIAELANTDAVADLWRGICWLCRWLFVNECATATTLLSMSFSINTIFTGLSLTRFNISHCLGIIILPDKIHIGYPPSTLTVTDYKRFFIMSRCNGEPLISDLVNYFFLLFYHGCDNLQSLR